MASDQVVVVLSKLTYVLRRKFVIEGFRDKQPPLLATFIDFKKAFDSINRKFMFAILRHYGVPGVVAKSIKVLYGNSKSAVMVNGMLSDPFLISTGVPQDAGLAPYLFLIVIDYLMVSATSQCQSGLITHTRQSRRHLELVINGLNIADDICLLESSRTRVQAQLDACSSRPKD